MKKILFIIPLLIGNITFAQAQPGWAECDIGSNVLFDGTRCAAGKTCVRAQGISDESNGKNGTGCGDPKEVLLIPQLGGGQNNNNNNSGNTNQNSQGPRPCGNPVLEAIAKVYDVRRAPIKTGSISTQNKTAGFTSGFAGFIRGFASIVAGDEQKCTYIPKSPEGRALADCKKEAGDDGTFIKYRDEAIRRNTAAGMPRAEISAKSAAEARRRILIECMKTLGMTDIAAAEKAVSDVTQQCKK